MGIDVSDFGVIQVGDYYKLIKLFKLKQGNAVVSVLNYGATIQSIHFPDKKGKVSDVVLGFDNQKGYFGANNPYFGSTVGRVANRIANGRFKVHGIEYNVSINRPPLTLHGGFHGLDKKIWDAVIDGESLILTCVSEHLEEGFPGYVEFRVIYEFTRDYELKIVFKAKTTMPTPINLTNHSYFNLAGHETGSEGIYQHEVFINADGYTPTDENSIPTGEIQNIKGTPLGFTVVKNLGNAIKASPANGFDYNYCINDYGKGVRLAARAEHAPSGRVLEVFTDQPGVQFYTGNFIDNISGKGGVTYQKHSGICFETQNYPNAVNTSCFPNSVLDPDKEYIHNCIYKFSVMN